MFIIEGKFIKLWKINRHMVFLKKNDQRQR